jgi:hypothetical protein
MAKVMSPNTPAAEIEGMKEAEQFFAARPQFSTEMVQMFGEQVYHRRNGSPKGEGFRRMAYIISSTRG